MANLYYCLRAENNTGALLLSTKILM